MVPFKNRLWALGDEMELWSSANGIDWMEETHTTPAISNLAQMLARSDRLVLIAGWQYSAPNYYRQVWQSTDGKSWSLLTNAAPFSATKLNQVQFLTIRRYLTLVFCTLIALLVMVALWR